MEAIQPAFTRPGFRNAWVIFAGWVLTMGTHAVTQSLIVTDVARRIHHERFHRFFSRGAWKTDDVGRMLFERILPMLLPNERIVVALDDTLAAKKGPEVWGIGSHLDAVRSTKRFRVFCFGHVWVVLSVVVSVPFSSRRWALPVLFRLYRNKKDCERRGAPYRKKTDLAREMLDLLVAWSGTRKLDVVGDSAYCNDTLMRGRDPRVTVIGSIRPDAVLTAPPTRAERKQTGRRRKRGKLLPKPEDVFDDGRRPWHFCKLTLYGRVTIVQYKTLVAQWYRGAGTQPGRIVVVRVDQGAVRMRVFFCSDAEREVDAILLTYSWRWALEVCFKDIKQLLGFADSSARKREAVERTAPFVGYAYTMLVLWFANGVWSTPLAAPPLRPWYTHRKHASFADVLRAAQRTLAAVDVLDPARDLDNLRELRAALRNQDPTTLNRVA
jgi:DDE superfamily endonuclease